MGGGNDSDDSSLHELFSNINKMNQPWDAALTSLYCTNTSPGAERRRRGSGGESGGRESGRDESGGESGGGSVVSAGDGDCGKGGPPGAAAGRDKPSPPPTRTREDFSPPAARGPRRDNREVTNIEDCVDGGPPVDHVVPASGSSSSCAGRSAGTQQREAGAAPIADQKVDSPHHKGEEDPHPHTPFKSQNFPTSAPFLGRSTSTAQERPGARSVLSKPVLRAAATWAEVATRTTSTPHKENQEHAVDKAFPRTPAKSEAFKNRLKMFENKSGTKQSVSGTSLTWGGGGPTTNRPAAGPKFPKKLVLPTTAFGKTSSSATEVRKNPSPTTSRTTSTKDKMSSSSGSGGHDQTDNSSPTGATMGDEQEQTGGPARDVAGRAPTNDTAIRTSSDDQDGAPVSRPVLVVTGGADCGVVGRNPNVPGTSAPAPTNAVPPNIPPNVVPANVPPNVPPNVVPTNVATDVPGKNHDVPSNAAPNLSSIESRLLGLASKKINIDMAKNQEAAGAGGSSTTSAPDGLVVAVLPPSAGALPPSEAEDVLPPSGAGALPPPAAPADGGRTVSVDNVDDVSPRIMAYDPVTNTYSEKRPSSTLGSSHRRAPQGGPAVEGRGEAKGDLSCSLAGELDQCEDDPEEFFDPFRVSVCNVSDTVGSSCLSSRPSVAQEVEE